MTNIADQSAQSTADSFATNSQDAGCIGAVPGAALDFEDPRVTRIQSTNALTAELRLTLFSSALYSLKSTTLLKPYPEEYFIQDTKEIDRERLISVFSNVPSLSQVTSSSSCPPVALDLVHWILTHGSMQLSPIGINQLAPKAAALLKENLRQAVGLRKNLAPKIIFAVTEPTSRRSKIEAFANLSALHGSFYAFHGSALENYHSILHNGLAISLNKRSLFGFGTYLSSKLAMAIEYSPFGINAYANRSCGALGRKVSCVALCEVIDHPDVEAKKKKHKEMPATYYVVSNNDLIRVAYLLVYSSIPDAPRNTSKSPKRETSTARSISSNSGFVLVVFLLLFLMIGYIMTRQ